MGSKFYLSYPELDVTGDAEVLAIHSCPPIPARPSPGHCLVTSKFTHEAAEVLDLSIEGVAGPIGVTPNHPIWSDDRREFVRANALAVGESLLDVQGARVAVQEITARSGLTEVFNLEVDGEHVYHVSAAGVLVHNNYTNGVAPKGVDPYMQRLSDWATSSANPANAPKSGLGGATRLTPDELATGQRLESQLGKPLRESPHLGAEYVDDVGRSYDALGTPNASKFWNQKKFLASIDGHLLKSNDFTVIDLTGFTPAQIAAVNSHLATLTPAQLLRIIRIGF